MRDFNKELFARLLKVAKGERSINHYGNVSQVDPSYISRLERKLVARPPSPEVIKKLAKKAYGVTYQDFMIAAGHISSLNDSNIFRQNIQFFQIAESVPEYSPLIDLAEIQPGEIFSFIAKDDSMQGSRILKGDRLLIKREEKVIDSKIALLLLDGKEILLRRINQFEDKLILQPENPNYKLELIIREKVEIVGQVVQVLFEP